jgi:hypothetical protein
MTIAMASRSYPIWNDVEACIYNSSKSYGAKDTSDCTVYVGSGPGNSHALVNHTTTRREDDERITFRFYVDGKKVKHMIFENNRGRAGKLIEEKSFL